MKANKILVVLLFILVLVVVAIGCKYDVAAPLWDSPVSTTVAATISSVNPAQASGGVNYITINGANFSGVVDTSTFRLVNTDRDTSIGYQGVYFNNVPAEIVDYSPTMIKVRRPNLAGDSCVVKVVPSKALLAGKYAPYKISSVMQKYGSYVNNLSLSTVAVDLNGNVYFIETVSYKIFKIAPDGTQSILATAPWEPGDMSIGPDGNLYLAAISSTSRRELAMVDVNTGTVTKRWRYLPQGKMASCCDFGKNGFLYLGGGSDLYILDPATPISGTTYPVMESGIYSSSDGYTINALRVFNGYVYVAVQTDAGQQCIWKNRINSDGSLDTTKILVLDWNSTSFASGTIKKLALSEDLRTLYIQASGLSQNFFILTSQGVDWFYKGVVRPYAVSFAWSSKSNYLYMIGGNATPTEEWNIYRVDMGVKSASR